MKANKTSTKTTKVSETAIAPLSEQSPADSKPVKRTTKSSTAAAKPVDRKTTHHRHSPVIPAPAPTPKDTSNLLVSTAASARLAEAPSKDEIARLAHAYFVERHYAHGFAEEDWLRAERALGAVS